MTRHLRLLRFAPEPASETRLRAAQGPPRVRGDCVDGPRPCPWNTCRHHLGPPSDDTCSLDVADAGPRTLEDVGFAMGITRQRVQQIEADALSTLRLGLARLGVEPGDWEDAADEESPAGDIESELEEPEDPLAEMAWRAYERRTGGGGLSPDRVAALVVAYRAMAAELGARPRLVAVARRAGVSGPRRSVAQAVYLALAAVDKRGTLPFFRDRGPK